jgi:modulator of FtsH protease
METSAAAWQNLFIATAGATAALTGLLFVAISINLERILAYPSLPGRAAQALIVLGNALLVSILGLVPGQDPEVLGVELVVLAVVAVTVPLRLELTALRTDADLRSNRRWFWSRVGMAMLATVPFLIGGLSLVLGAGGGLYWLVPGMCFAIVVAVVDGWVLLIEILR